jgi:hypothetical protein
LEREITTILAVHWVDMLKMGSAVHLLITGRLEAVLPPDDAEFHHDAGSLQIGGKRDPTAAAHPEQTMAKNALNPCSAIAPGSRLASNR